MARTTGDVLGTLDSLFDHARKHFVDEIFFASPAERGVIKNVLDQSRIAGIDLRVVPEMYDGLAWNSPIEYIGQFPTIPLHCGYVPELGVDDEARGVDRGCSRFWRLARLLFARHAGARDRNQVGLFRPGLLPFGAHRQKGLVFRCIKFRTMIADADKRRSDLMHLNERDGVLFKISTTRGLPAGPLSAQILVGRITQFFNVLQAT